MTTDTPGTRSNRPRGNRAYPSRPPHPPLRPTTPRPAPLGPRRLYTPGPALRAKIILRAADGDHPTNLCIAAELGCDNDTVASWRRRFAQDGLAGLLDRPGKGAPEMRIR